MSVLEWLVSPIDPDRLHDVNTLLSWHGRLMMAAWTCLVPIAIIAARFFKIFPGQEWPRELDDKRWWYAHRVGQNIALVCMLGGLGCVLYAEIPVTSATSSISIHRSLGWGVLGLGTMQYISAWLRGSKGGPTAPASDGSFRGDHYDMSLRRRIFERIHKSFGYLALLISAAAVTSGLWQTNGPRWMFIVIAVWYVAVGTLFVILQRRRLAFDTYQAIWGPDPKHPGNRVKPIGIGITRSLGKSAGHPGRRQS